MDSKVYTWASLVAQLVKNQPPMPETWVWSMGWGDPLEKGKATNCSLLAWRIPWTVQPMGSQSWTRLSDLHFHFKICIHRLKVYIHRRRYSWWVYIGKLSQQYYPQFQPEGRKGKQDDYPKKRGRFSRLRYLGSIIQEGDRHANSPVPSGTYRPQGRGRVAICVVTSPTVHSDASSSLGIDAMTLLALTSPFHDHLSSSSGSCQHFHKDGFKLHFLQDLLTSTPCSARPQPQVRHTGPVPHLPYRGSNDTLSRWLV